MYVPNVSNRLISFGVFCPRYKNAKELIFQLWFFTREPTKNPPYALCYDAIRVATKNALNLLKQQRVAFEMMKTKMIGEEARSVNERLRE